MRLLTSFSLVLIIISCSADNIKPNNELSDTLSIEINSSGTLDSISLSSFKFPLNKLHSTSYSFGDSGKYNSSLAGGKYLTLYSGQTFIDTIDHSFGIYEIENVGLIFLPLRNYVGDSGDLEMDITNHVIYHNGERRIIKSILSNFNDYFSSPDICDNELYYWGFSDNFKKVYAAKYSFMENKSDSLLLNIEVKGTDDRFSFTQPLFNGDTVLFYYSDKSYFKLNRKSFEKYK